MSNIMTTLNSNTALLWELCSIYQLWVVGTKLGRVIIGLDYKIAKKTDTTGYENMADLYNDAQVTWYRSAIFVPRDLYG